jgi:hypothetical protein
MDLLNHDIDVILVHTGNHFYDYINDCIYMLERYKFKIHIIISRNLVNRLDSDNIIVIFAEDYYDERLELYHSDMDDFRDGFWKRTSSRFILIDNYVTKNKIKSFFHIENDILVFSDFKDIKNVLDNKNEEMFIILDSTNRCIPSIVYFKNFDITNKLSQFIIDNKDIADMYNLFTFYSLNKNIVDNLPIISEELISNNINFSNCYNDFNSIFDGAAIGQYLGGIDPRNNSSNSIGFVNEQCIFNVSNYKYIWNNNEPYMIVKDGSMIKINNLHIHSKNLKKFINNELPTRTKI